MSRQASQTRDTRETKIKLSLNLDGQGKADIHSGVGFFDHMMELFVHHSRFDLSLKAEGDLQVDDHHTVEDCGILLGQAFREALGDKAGICRYADIALPMDETLVRLALDISGRPFLAFAVDIPQPKIGTFDSELVEEWFRAFAMQAGLTLHLDLVRGHNSHHIAEACFKALGRALRQAVSIDASLQGEIPSSKGSL